MEVIVSQSEIENSILIINGEQVILDRDLAMFYDVEIKRLNEQVKRNINRFPSDFCFQLTEEQYNSLRSQNATLESGKGKHRKYLPYVYTEEGVAAVSAVIKNDKAAQVSVQIMRAFVKMRKFLINNASMFERIYRIEHKQWESDQKFEQIFKALENKDMKSEKGIFFEGQVFDAYVFVSDIIKNAKKSIILIDNYIDETVLTLLSKRKKEVSAVIYTKEINKQLLLDLKKYNEQYPKIEIKTIASSHDRFLLIDGDEVYHIGASLKDLGKKWFAFSRMDSFSKNILDRLN